MKLWWNVFVPFVNKNPNVDIVQNLKNSMSAYCDVDGDYVVSEQQDTGFRIQFETESACSKCSFNL